MKRKVMVVHPGVSWSVADWFDGLVYGMEQFDDVELQVYNLPGMIDVSQMLLEAQWSAAGSPQDNKPSAGDVYYRASSFILERALRWGADAVVVIAGMYFHPDFLLMLRRAGIRVVTVLTESPYRDDGQLPYMQHADSVCVNERTTAVALQRMGANAFYLPAGYIPARHSPEATLDTRVTAHDLVFVGTPWPERTALFNALARDEMLPGVDVGIYGAFRPEGFYREWVRDGITENETTAQLYRRAAIGLNLHRSHPTAESTNNRTYELAASGCFFVSDERAELVQEFGDAVPTFGSVEELAALVLYYKDRPQERADRVRKALQCVSGHTWLSRARILYDALAKGD